jgi:homotetrameric cytidine deaminase
MESASFSLTLPALVNAVTTAVALDRYDDVVACVLSRPLRPAEVAYLETLPRGPFEPVADDAWVTPEADGALPEVTRGPADATLTSAEPPRDGTERISDADGIALARSAAGRAYVPASDFPVGAVLETSTGALVPGVNVEHTDWTRILCGERNALGTVLSYGHRPAGRLFLSCPHDPSATPCGACRQLLVELLPEGTLCMDRHSEPAEKMPVDELLPNSFQGRTLRS